MTFVAISGSLRAESSNSALLKAAAEHAPAGLEISIFGRMAAIPAFNPDDERAAQPDAVVALRAAVSDADAVLFSTPEYAHGVPGALKNALDWVVGSGEFYEKPVAFFHASERGQFARASLKETLVTMGAFFVGNVVVDPTHASELRSRLLEIAEAARKARATAQNI